MQNRLRNQNSRMPYLSVKVYIRGSMKLSRPKPSPKLEFQDSAIFYEFPDIVFQKCISEN